MRSYKIAGRRRDNHVAHVEHGLIAQQIHGGVNAFIEMLSNIFKDRDQQQTYFQAIQRFQYGN